MRNGVAARAIALAGRGALLAALAGLAPAACATRRGAHGADARAREHALIAVRVENLNVADMDVYAVGGGVPTRLGTVAGGATMSVAIDPARFPTGELQLVGTAVAGGGDATSGMLHIAGGRRITFVIGARLEDTSAMVR